jgi:sugar phosphate isomerase/epimerase
VEAIRESQSLGFSSVELYAHWLPAQLGAVNRTLAELGMRVSSLHAPCPVPVDGAGQRVTCGDWLAETDEQRRRLALDAQRRTIETAAELGASAVVVHLGNTGARSLQGDIFAAIRAHGAGSDQHLELLEQARNERGEAISNGPLEAAVRSARAIGEQAREAGVKLGLECRDGFVEIPTLADYPTIFDACAGLPVYYWHDAGHASKLENAGFLKSEDYLLQFGDRLLGIHLHDTRLDIDHQAPGQGETNFTRLAPYVKPETIRTLELSPRVPAADIAPGVAVLEEAGLL